MPFRKRSTKVKKPRKSKVGGVILDGVYQHANSCRRLLEFERERELAEKVVQFKQAKEDAKVILYMLVSKFIHDA
jgi:hypothetical protein